jgi:sugar-phosphatase
MSLHDRTILGEAVLFDLDGTLVNSDAVVERCWRRWAAGAGVDAEWLLTRVHGRQSREVIAELFPERGPARNLAEAEEMLAWEMADSDGVVPVPGAPELLAGLDGAPWGIVTSCPRPLAETRLRAARLPIPAVMITGDQVAVGKPDPEGYLEGAASLGKGPGGCVAFEDAEAGVRAALAAGMTVVGVGRRVAGLGCALEVMTLETVRVTAAGEGVSVRVI